jgi:hypothetical protein
MSSKPASLCYLVSGTGRVAEVVEHLLSKCEAPSSNPCTRKKKQSKGFSWQCNSVVERIYA